MSELSRRNGVRAEVFCESVAGYLTLWAEAQQIVDGKPISEPSLILGPIILDVPRGSWLGNPEVEHGDEE